jgi:hypothetical protein
MANGVSGSSPTGAPDVDPGIETSPPTTTLGSLGAVPTSGSSVLNVENVIDALADGKIFGTVV